MDFLKFIFGYVVYKYHISNTDCNPTQRLICQATFQETNSSLCDSSLVLRKKFLFLGTYSVDLLNERQLFTFNSLKQIFPYSCVYSHHVSFILEV